MVISNAGRPLTVSQLNRDFKEFEGYDIPYEKHGFRQLDAMLQSMSDAVQINGQGPSAQLLPVLTKNSKHIREMVEKQKNKNGKRKVQYAYYTHKKRRIDVDYQAPKKAPEPVAKSRETQSQKQGTQNVNSAKNRWDQQFDCAPISTKCDSSKWTRSNFTQLSDEKTNQKQSTQKVLYVVSNSINENQIKTSTGYGNYATADENNNRNHRNYYGTTGYCGYSQNRYNTQQNYGNSYGTYNTNNGVCNSGYTPYGVGYFSNSNAYQNSGYSGNNCYVGGNPYNTYNASRNPTQTRNGYKTRNNSIDSQLHAYCMHLLNYFNESAEPYQTIINTLEQYSPTSSQGLAGTTTKYELLISLTRTVTQLQQIHNLLIYSPF